jgi:hypothetical protein
MRLNLKAVAVLIAVVSIAVSALAAPPAKTYQVTGPVLAVTSDLITVQKGADKWELARDASTKVNGDLKVGSDVTIQYRMIATTVDVKAEKGKAEAGKAEKGKAEKGKGK